MANAGQFVELFVIAIVAVALYGPLVDFIEGINATGTAATLLDLVPLLYIILIVAGFAFALTAMSKRGK